MSKQDYYEALGIAKDADKKIISKAFRKLARKCHPDSQKGKTDAEKEAAEVQYQLINEAQEVLTDEGKRVVYDEYGHQGLDNYDPNSGTSSSDYQPPAKKHTWNSTMSFFDDEGDEEDDAMAGIKERMAANRASNAAEGEGNMTPGQRRRAKMKARREAAAQDNNEETASKEPEEEEDNTSRFNRPSSRKKEERVILVSLPLDLVQNTIDILQSSGLDDQANKMQTALSSAPRKMDTRPKF